MADNVWQDTGDNAWMDTGDNVWADGVSTVSAGLFTVTLESASVTQPEITVSVPQPAITISEKNRIT